VRQGCNRRECGIDRLVWRETLAETYRKGTGVERIECGHAINNDEPVSVELQLHQQLFAEGVDEVGGVGSASHMADLDTCAGDLGQVHIRATGYQSWQSVFDGAQRFQHLPGQEELGPPLCLAYGQHVANPLLRPVLPQPCPPFLRRVSRSVLVAQWCFRGPSGVPSPH
jgi:hypothetical protein